MSYYSFFNYKLNYNYINANKVLAPNSFITPFLYSQLSVVEEKNHFQVGKRQMATPSKKKMHSCQECGSEFSVSSSLKKHMQIHTGVKLFSYQVCGSAFSESSSLKKHMRIHSGEKPFSCEVCRSAFSVRSNLRKTYENTYWRETIYL